MATGSDFLRSHPDNMATGSDFIRSHSLTSDQVFDRNCSLCEEDNTIKEAISCCTACCRYFCTQCLEFHNKLRRDHRNTLLDKSAMLKSLLKTTSLGTLTKTCEQHDGKLLEMFCRQHNVVCCTVCLTTKHKLCDDGQYIPQIANEFSQNPEISRVKTELQKVKENLLRMKSSRQNDQLRIKEEVDRVLAQVKDSRQKINAHLDKLEESVMNEVDQRYQNYHERVQKDLTQCDEAIKKIEEAVKELGDTDGQNEAELFVNVKKGAENVDGWRELSRQIQGQLGKENIGFTVDESVEKCVTSLQSLGTFIEELKIPSKLRVVIRNKDAMVKMKNDDKACNILGSCCLPNGGALLTDWSNKKLKRVDSSYRVTDCLKMNGPCGVCYIQHKSEAAVTLGNNQNVIQIVSIGSRMKAVRSIKLAGEFCIRVTYNNGLLYVTQDNDKLCIYDYETEQLQTTVDSDSSGQKLFSDYIRYVGTCLDGTRIWITDAEKGLILLDKDLQLVRVVTDSDLEEAEGVCTDHDDVLVCGHKSRSVLQLTGDGEKIGTLVPPGGLPAEPVSVCFDTTRSRLIVTMEDYDSIRVYYLR